MLGKKLNKQILLLAVIIGLIFFMAFLFYSTPVKSVKITPIPVINKVEEITKTEQVITKTEQTSFGLPISLIVPKINVSSTIEYVELTPDGAMDVPKDQNNVAWFKIGIRPGEKGTAVIDGHYGWKDGKPSAFDNLYKLRPGDKILIKDDKGVDVSFMVREMKRYSSGANAKAVFISNDNKSHLNLITCEGTWNKDSKGYSTRLVIFTDKVVE